MTLMMIFYHPPIHVHVHKYLLADNSSLTCVYRVLYIQNVWLEVLYSDYVLYDLLM